MLNSKQIQRLLSSIADLYIEKENELSKYDAVIGDGDHGITMARGALAAKEKVAQLREGSCTDYFKLYGRTLVSSLGGAMGPMFGSIFLEIAKSCEGAEEIGLNEIAVGLRNAQAKIMELGGAQVGDKTMIDAIDPAVASLGESLLENASMQEAMKKATFAANEGVLSTIPLIAKRGRSRYLQEKSIGHQDAGATSFYYLMKCISEFIEENE